nr:antA/AntB antirepressor family protein [Sphingopyxis sp. MC1]
MTDDQKVDARALHGWLGIATRFNDWIAKIMDDYGFEEGSDFYSNLSKTGGRPRKDYLLSLDVAKEIAMIGNTPKGKATRRYFIAAEKAAAAPTSSAPSSWTAILGSAAPMCCTSSTGQRTARLGHTGSSKTTKFGKLIRSTLVSARGGG